MKDNFSTQSDKYALYRPDYPEELLRFIFGYVKEKKTAWDCGTGSGQLAEKLADRFERVYATDLSENQIANAVPKENITYKVMSAEDATFSGKQFDLITVAQAIHWFDFDRFYDKVRETLQPWGIIAIIGYDVIKISPECDKIINRLYNDVLGEYWDSERRHIDTHYQSIPFPFDEIPAPEFTQKVNWSFGHLIGYLNTWSAVRHYMKKNDQNPIELIKEELQIMWGSDPVKELQFPVFLRMGRNVKFDDHHN